MFHPVSDRGLVYDVTRTSGNVSQGKGMVLVHGIGPRWQTFELATSSRPRQVRSGQAIVCSEQSDSFRFLA